MLDTDPEKAGECDRRPRGPALRRTCARRCVENEDIIVGVLAVPDGRRPAGARDDLIDAGVKIIFNYSEALLDVPGDVAVHASNPAVELLYALYFHLT